MSPEDLAKLNEKMYNVIDQIAIKGVEYGVRCGICDVDRMLGNGEVLGFTSGDDDGENCPNDIDSMK
ncbi:hypothetical protein HK097_001685 [Rhizophlyctis rosea]|uniref:Uncharacterized protein n=1 Tax=Rhizophlyctis rosea TaxID=64517 RepID=A0AAD5WYT3_9FUNG|nr:hypothetical protein HK097_001685 [Rhizophlyctis rosea]